MKLVEKRVIRVLFVCLGNICRSPMAEAVMQDLITNAGLNEQIIVDSAGTGGWHVGDQADSRTLKVLRQHNIPYNGRARQFMDDDMATFDYIVGMDANNLMNIRTHQKTPSVEIELFLSYANHAGLTDVREVPDPYYNNRFDEVYELVQIGCQALLNHIRQKHDI